MSRKRYTPEQTIRMLREAEVALAQGQTTARPLSDLHRCDDVRCVGTEARGVARLSPGDLIRGECAGQGDIAQLSHARVKISPKRGDDAFQ